MRMTNLQDKLIEEPFCRKGERLKSENGIILEKSRSATHLIEHFYKSASWEESPRGEAGRFRRGESLPLAATPWRRRTGRKALLLKVPKDLIIKVSS